MTDIVIDPHPSTIRSHSGYGYDYVEHDGRRTYNDDSLSDEDCAIFRAEIGASGGSGSPWRCYRSSSILTVSASTLSNGLIGILIMSTTERGAGLWGGTLLLFSLLILVLSTANWWYRRVMEEEEAPHRLATERSRRLLSMAQLAALSTATIQLVAAVVAVSRKWMPRWAVATSLLVAAISSVQVRSLMQFSRSHPWIIDHAPSSSQSQQPTQL